MNSQLIRISSVLGYFFIAAYGMVLYIGDHPAVAISLFFVMMLCVVFSLRGGNKCQS